MKIRLLAFASAGDALGASELEMEMPEGSRVADLRERLDRDHPRLAPLWPRLAVAVEGRVAGQDEPLTEGAEVALLPPVSGGSGKSGLTEDRLDVDAIVESVSAADCGAVVVFLGNVRNHQAGRQVEKLTYYAYRRMAEDGLVRIVAELEASAPGLRAAIVHRLGDVPVGEASVVIAVASPHRAAAYEASRTALERLKAEIPVWKREHYAGGEVAWREEEPLKASETPSLAGMTLSPAGMGLAPRGMDAIPGGETPLPGRETPLPERDGSLLGREGLLPGRDGRRP